MTTPTKEEFDTFLLDLELLLSQYDEFVDLSDLEDDELLDLSKNVTIFLKKHKNSKATLSREYNLIHYH